jgi:hypothetical protein
VGPDGAQDKVPRARVDQAGEQLARRGGPGEPRWAVRERLLGGEYDLGGAGDLGRVAADGGAALVERGVLAAEVRDKARRPSGGVITRTTVTAVISVFTPSLRRT